MTAVALDICNRAIQKVGGPVLSDLLGTDVYTVAVNRVYANVRDSELRSHNWNFAIKRISLSVPEITITGITAATPPVLTYTGTDPSNGDRIYISDVIGMTEVNNNYYRIANVNTGANTFELTDVDTGDNIVGIGFTAWSSGGVFIVVPYYGWNRRFSLPSDFIRLIEVDGMEGVSANLGGMGNSNDYTIEGRYITCNDSGPIFIRYVFQETTVDNWDMMFREAVASKIAFEISTEIKQTDQNKQILSAEYKETIRQAKIADAIETPGEIIPICDWLKARV